MRIVGVVGIVRVVRVMRVMGIVRIMRVVGVMGVVIPVRKIDILCSNYCRIMQNERNITGIILFLQS